MNQRIPRSALMLGIAGLVPFVALPMLRLVDATEVIGFATDRAILALHLYAAIILSFMGGVQWGLAVNRPVSTPRTLWRSFGVSVLPALLAWVAFALPTRPSLVVLASGFALLLAYDIWTVRRNEAPVWYAKLRLGLTTVVVTALCLTSALLI